MPVEPLLTFSIRLWPVDKRILDKLAQLCEDATRTDVIRALLYLGLNEPMPPELQAIADHFEGLYISAAPSASAPVINVTIDTTPIADALRGGPPAPFTDPPSRPNLRQ